MRFALLLASIALFIGQAWAIDQFGCLKVVKQFADQFMHLDQVGLNRSVPVRAYLAASDIAAASLGGIHERQD